MLRSLGIAVLALATSCTYFSGDSTVLVATDPPGAEILVDGETSGYTTPARLDLGGYFGTDHEITVRMDGYDPESRKVIHRNSYGMSRWSDGADLRAMSNPLWWTFGDFITPFSVKWRFFPNSLQIKLYEEGQGPVHAADPPVDDAQ